MAGGRGALKVKSPAAYTAVGPAGGPAHGAGGGIPVYVGAGTVEGLGGGDEGEEEVQVIELPPPSTPPRRTRGRTGGGVRR
jgi:hypothetical protein